ncbi:MAG: hypothetical protein K2L77_06405, partial [Muribaculaceae bacterium]|nr:hypothetical protein [Muribaculaceae bacterium]
HTLYTRAFHRWYARTYGHERARDMPRYLILALEMMRLRSPMRHVRIMIHDPTLRLGPWLLAYARWINERIIPGADPIIVRPGPRHLGINTRKWPGLRFRSLLRPQHLRGHNTALAMVVCADRCGPRPRGHDLFWHARAILTGMVHIRGTMLIFHGDARRHRHHFRDACMWARSHPGETPFIIYDDEHPQAVIAQLMRYRRELRQSSTTATVAEAPPAPRLKQLHPRPRRRPYNAREALAGASYLLRA